MMQQQQQQQLMTMMMVLTVMYCTVLYRDNVTMVRRQAMARPQVQSSTTLVQSSTTLVVSLYITIIKRKINNELHVE
jgi:hypothetical protein